MNDFFNNLNEILKTKIIYLEKFEVNIDAVKKDCGNYYLSISFNNFSYNWVRYDNFTLLFKTELNNFIDKYFANKNIWDD